MKLIIAIVMSFVLTFINLLSWLAVGIVIVVAAIITLPIWAYQEYKLLTKGSRG